MAQHIPGSWEGWLDPEYARVGSLEEGAELRGAGRERTAAGGGCRGGARFAGRIWASLVPALGLSWPSLQGACGRLAQASGSQKDCHLQIRWHLESERR